MNRKNIRPFNHAMPNGRNFEGYGNTRLSDAPRVFALRPLVLPALAVMTVGCGLIVMAMAVAS